MFARFLWSQGEGPVSPLAPRGLHTHVHVCADADERWGRSSCQANFIRAIGTFSGQCPNFDFERWIWVGWGTQLGLRWLWMQLLLVDVQLCSIRRKAGHWRCTASRQGCFCASASKDLNTNWHHWHTFFAQWLSRVGLTHHHFQKPTTNFRSQPDQYSNSQTHHQSHHPSPSTFQELNTIFLHCFAPQRPTAPNHSALLHVHSPSAGH